MELIKIKQIDGLEGKLLDEKDKNYVHTQVSGSDRWAVQHNLNKYPSVTILDTEDRQQFAYIENIDNNNLMIEFTYPCCGKVICN